MGIDNTVYDLNILSKYLFGNKVEDEHTFLVEWFSKYMVINVYDRKSLVYGYNDVINYFNDKYEDLNSDSVSDILLYIRMHQRNEKINDLLDE